MLSLAFSLSAAPTDSTLIITAANNWLKHQPLTLAAATQSGIQPSIAQQPIPILDTNNSLLAWHVPLAPQGYILLQPDDRLTPVRAFSFESNLDLQDSPDNTLRALLWRDQRAAHLVLQQLDDPRTISTATVLEQTAANRTEWLTLASPPLSTTSLPAPTNTLVPPLLMTAWSQWNHYNDYCPDASPSLPGYDGKAPVGCVAVSGAQVMKYYNWPAFGSGSHTYTDNRFSITGTFSAVFSDTYDWTNMRSNYSAYSSYDSNQVHAIAELMSEVGVAVEMNYQTNAASASMSDLLYGLSDYFRYTIGAYTRTNLNTQIRSELFARRPVIVSIPGHAFVLDGLSSDSNTNVIHANYGWGGVNDGWYLISDINGYSLEDALIGVEPLALPLMNPVTPASNITGIVNATWEFPAWHTSRVSRFKLDQGTATPTNFTDACDTLGEWTVQGDPWIVSNAVGNPGNCFSKRDNMKTGWLTSPLLVTRTNSLVLFNYRLYIYASDFVAQVSTNRGDNWTTLFTDSGITGWMSETLSLSPWTNTPLMLRFGYVAGSSYYSSGYARVDNITFSNLCMLTWSPVSTTLTAAARSFTYTNSTDGLAYLRVQAETGGVWLAATLPSTVTCDLAGDADGDSLPNGWEFLWSSNPTNLIATSDQDADGLDNLSEYLCGTCPTNPTSVLALTSIQTTNGTEIAWQTVSGHVYSIWASTNLLDPDGFTAIATGLISNADSLQFHYTNAPPAPQRFYRITAD